MNRHLVHACATTVVGGAIIATLLALSTDPASGQGDRLRTNRAGSTANPAATAPPQPAAQPATPAAQAFTLVGVTATAGTVMLKDRSGRDLRLQASTAAAAIPGPRGVRVPASITAQVVTGVLQKMQAEAMCAQIETWLNDPPLDLGVLGEQLADAGFPINIDFSPTWTCEAELIENTSPAGLPMPSTWGCDCQPSY